MSKTPIGIDLGTTFSAVGTVDDDGRVRLLPNAEGETLTPSAIFFEKPGNIVVGSVAKDARTEYPLQVVEFIKRSMGTDRTFEYLGEKFTATELSAIILKKLKQDAEAALGGQEIKQVVITCPAYFGAEKRDATEKAAKIAGLEVQALLNEPTAAAIAFGMGVQKAGVALIFDLGGGTFDVTIVRFGEDKSIAVLATDGDHELGGKDFDDALMEMGIKQFQQEHSYDILADVEALAELRQKAEKVKRDLTARESATLLVTAGGEKSKLTITREQFAAAIRPHLEGMKMTMLNTLEDAKLKPQDITDVLLVGGSSRIPAVRDMVKELLGREPNTAIHPDEAVAMGAALYSAKLADSTAATPTEMTQVKRSENVPNVYDITPHSIGTTAYDGKDRKHNSIILPRGAKLPATAKQRYSTKVEGQKTARVDVNEGENEDISFVRQIGSFTLTFPAARKANSPIDVEVWMDVSGIIRVVAVDVLSNKHEEITIDYTVNMNQAEVEDRAGWLKDQNIG